MKNLPETLVELDRRRDNFVLMKYNSIRLRLIELYFIWTKLSLLLCNSTSVSGGFFNNTESNITIFMRKQKVHFEENILFQFYTNLIYE